MSPSCIDLYRINCPKNFESTLAIETGLSDFHKLIVTVLKFRHERLCNTETIKTFEKPQSRLSNLDMNTLDFGSLKKCFMELLNKVAPLKSKFLRANHYKFVTKDVSKSIILKTKLRNQFLKERTLEVELSAISRGIFVSVLSKKLSKIITKI